MKPAKRGDPKRAVAYVRVSTSQQDLGPKAQRAQLGAYARAAGIRIVRWRSEKCSGSRPPERRQRFLLALADLRELNAGTFLIWKRDRFMRGSVVRVAAAEASIEKQGAEIVSTDGISNGTSPEAELLRRIIDAVAHYERMMARVRTRQAILVKRRRGEYTGGPTPFGWRRHGKKLEPHPEETQTLQMIHKLAGVGMRSTSIAHVLQKDGVRCRGMKWHARTISRVLARMTP